MLAESLTPGLAAGFGAQVLLGALSYLIPVVAGGGPSGARAANVELDRGGALRVGVTNAGVLVFLLPSPSMVRVVVSAFVLAALASFLPLMFRAVSAARRVGPTRVGSLPTVPRSGPAPVAADRPKGQRTGLAATGIALVVIAVATGVALDPHALGGVRHVSSADGVAPTGRTTRIEVAAKDMRFTPDTVQVPAGNRLVIDLKNTDNTSVHDLVLDSGADSGRLAPGRGTVLDAGVVGRDIEGWCSAVGHRQMGMVFHVHVTGLASARHDPVRSGIPDMTGPAAADSAAPRLDFAASPAAGFRAHDPSLPPVGAARVHRRTFRVSDMRADVAPGVSQQLWTYNGTVPGPDTARHGWATCSRSPWSTTARSGHSIDFHAGALAPDQPMRTMRPGESLRLPIHRHHSGIWLYHCSTMPMSVHIANGMFGAVVSTRRACRRWTRAMSWCSPSSTSGRRAGPADATKLLAEEPDAVVFNGYVNQYDHRPLTARVGERVRIWVLDAGPNRRSPSTSSAASSTRCSRRAPTCYDATTPSAGASQVLVARTRPGRVRRADLPAGRALPVRLAPHGRRRAGRPRRSSMSRDDPGADGRRAHARGRQRRDGPRSRQRRRDR